jgi:hypothetical protein
MPEPAAPAMRGAHARAFAAPETERRRFPAPTKAMDTYRVLGRTLTTFVSSGMTKEQSFIKAVEEAGGRVFRKFYSQFNKYEIAAIVFRDAALVKNDAEFIAAQDFSGFGKDAERIRAMAVEKAKKSKGGVHVFEGEAGIPVLRGRGEGLVFLSMDEMLAGGGRTMHVKVVDTSIDPKTLDEFREGARALREGDRGALERLTRASGAHAETREKSIDPLATYTLLDARTGDEISAAAANAKLGRAFQAAPGHVFVPESTLINRFVADAARLQPLRTERAAWEAFYLLPKPPDEDSDRRFGLRIYSVCSFGQASQEDPHEAPVEQRMADAKGPVSQTALFDAFPQTRAPAKGRATQAPLAQHPQALMFDGFALPQKPDANARAEKPETKKGPAPAEPVQRIPRTRFEAHAVVPKAETIIAARETAVPKTTIPDAGGREEKPCMPRMPERMAGRDMRNGSKGDLPPGAPGAPRMGARKPKQKPPERQAGGKRLEKEKKKRKEKTRKTRDDESGNVKTGNPKAPAPHSKKQKKSNRPNRATKRPKAGLEAIKGARKMPKKKDGRKNKPTLRPAVLKANERKAVHRVRAMEKKAAAAVQATKNKANAPQGARARQRNKMKQTKKPQGRNDRVLQALLPAFISRRARASGSSGRRRA